MSPDFLTPIDWDTTMEEVLERLNDPSSHTERNASTFHPSQLAFCHRQCYLRKLGLIDLSDHLGTLRVGTILHEFIQTHLDIDRLEFERPINYEIAGIEITGHADCYDPHTGIVYDWKTRKNWYSFDPPNDRHLNQLTLYQAGLSNADGQIVYVAKGDLEVRPHPEDATHEFDPERFADQIEKAQDVKAAIEEHGIARSETAIPFAKCGCFFCGSENLVFDDQQTRTVERSHLSTIIDWVHEDPALDSAPDDSDVPDALATLEQTIGVADDEDLEVPEWAVSTLLSFVEYDSALDLASDDDDISVAIDAVAETPA